MYASSILLTLGALLATSFAAPAPVEGTLETSIVPFGDSLNPRDKSAIITTYSGDTCNGNNSDITLVGGGNRGTNVDNMRSISALGSGCHVIVWAGANCQGNSAVIKYGSCNSVLFGSVLVACS